MKLKIIPTIKQGLMVIIKNSVILASIIIHALWWGICYYFYITYDPLQLTEHFRLYFILFMLVSIFLSLIICKMVYDAVKSNVSVSEAINLSAKKFIFIVIAYILYYLIIHIGFIALIIPGIFLFVKLWFFDYAILLDNERIIDSFKKSWQITKGNWWEVFGLYLMFVIPMVIFVWFGAKVLFLSSYSIMFIWILLSGWLISTFTIAYIQLTTQENKETIKKG